MQKLYSLLGNSQRLDGGSMFGNVPKAMWEKWVDVDKENRISLACRALLVEEDNGRRILFETGVGAFFPPKYRERYGIVEKEHVLLKSLKAIGLTHEDIDVIVLSHLHFDHAGGLLAAFQEGEESSLLFPNAEFIVGQTAFRRAEHPHLRDRASFIDGLPELLKRSGRLHLVYKQYSDLLGDNYTFHYSDGHTPGLLVTEIATDEGPLLFASDLIPGKSWVHLPVTMGYDRYPEELINEKQIILKDLVARKGRLFYTHDNKTDISRIEEDEKGRFKACD